MLGIHYKLLHYCQLHVIIEYNYTHNIHLLMVQHGIIIPDVFNLFLESNVRTCCMTIDQNKITSQIHVRMLLIIIIINYYYNLYVVIGSSIFIIMFILLYFIGW